MNMSKKVGFDRAIKPGWMDITADLAMQGYWPEDINRKLEELLMDQIEGKEARRKTRTVLLAVWVKTRDDLLALRSDAFELLRSIPSRSRIAVHWGMSMAVHPFFGHVAAVIGRLFSLQGMASTSEIQRRVRETYGERQTVSRSVRSLLLNFSYWGVLTNTTERSIHTPSPKVNIDEPRLIAWLVEAFLYASDSSSGTIDSILKSPNLFPFALGNISSRDLSLSGRLHVVRHGLDEELVMLSVPAYNQQ